MFANRRSGLTWANFQQENLKGSQVATHIKVLHVLGEIFFCKPLKVEIHKINLGQPCIILSREQPKVILGLEMELIGACIERSMFVCVYFLWEIFLFGFKRK